LSELREKEWPNFGEGEKTFGDTNFDNKKVDFSVNRFLSMRGASSSCYLSFPLLEIVNLSL
jgi:hypothetical protein